MLPIARLLEVQAVGVAGEDECCPFGRGVEADQLVVDEASECAGQRIAPPASSQVPHLRVP